MNYSISELFFESKTRNCKGGEFTLEVRGSDFIYFRGFSGPATPGGGTGHGPPTFLRSKNKKRKPRKKRTIFKAGTIERLSPRSKYYCFTHSRMSRIQKKFLDGQPWQYFSVFHGPSTLKSISPALYFRYKTEK